MESHLSPRERDTLLLLGDQGSGGDFDQIAMSKLFVLGLVEIQSKDRRLILTKAGCEAYAALRAGMTGVPRFNQSSRER
jgi:hypothetical protein